MPLSFTQPSSNRFSEHTAAPRFGYAVLVQGNDLTQVRNEVNRCLTRREPSSFLTMTEIHEVNGKQNIQEVYLDQTHLDSFLSRSQAANTQRPPAIPDLQPEYPIKKSFSTYNYKNALGRHVTFQGPEADISGLLEEPGIGLILNHLATTQTATRQKKNGLAITIWPDETSPVSLMGRVLKRLSRLFKAITSKDD